MLQVLDNNDPPRVSDALLAANLTMFALENVWHETHRRPSRLLSVSHACHLPVA